MDFASILESRNVSGELGHGIWVVWIYEEFQLNQLTEGIKAAEDLESLNYGCLDLWGIPT
jgi:hypothetical protein